jgi:hypothetical protein
MQVRKVLSLFCFMLMNSLLLFSTCPKSTPNGSLISNLATERGTFKVLAKSARTYILGHHGRYITVVDTESCLSALCLSNQTTLRAIRILTNLKSPLRFTVDFQVKDPAFVDTASITLTDEQLNVLGADYTSQLHNEFAADQYNSTFLKRKNDSPVNFLEPAQKRQNVLLPVASLLLADPVLPMLPVAPLLPVSPPPVPDAPSLPVSPVLDPAVSPVLPAAPLLTVAASPYNDRVIDKILSYNTKKESYLVRFMEPCKTKTTELVVSKFDLMRLRGGYYAIGEYTRLLFTRPKETTPTSLRVSDTVQATPDQGLCGLPPKACNLHAVNFHPKVDKYTMNFSVPGQDSIITRLISTSELLQFPNGKEAIQVYTDLHKPKKLPVAPPPIDHPAGIAV